MPLRARLVTSIALALVLSLMLGAALAAWHAARSVRTELQAALAVADQTARSAIAELPEANDPGAAVRRLVAAFDGNRHVFATLQDEAGHPAAVSRLAVPAEPPPHWLRRLLRPVLPAVALAVPGGRVLLVADDTNEVSEVWSAQRDTALVLTLFCGVACVLVWLILGQALRPLGALSAAFALLGGGALAARVRPAGAPELRRLAQGFNDMAERLAAVEAHNRRLHAQLLSLQEEERAELARDLHDEIGPVLFTAGMDAATLQRLAASGPSDEVLAQARAIQEAIGHAQKHVRAILGRLRAAHPATLDLAAAVDDLIAFWRRRHPAIVFAADLAVPAELGEAVRETIYRVVQEGLSNAVRHGRPRSVHLAAGCDADGTLVVRVCDDGQGAVDGGEPGFGLIGMRERLARLGGTLAVESRHAGGGWALTARLPAEATAERRAREGADEAVAGG